jgi:O-antigen ligase
MHHQAFNDSRATHKPIRRSQSALLLLAALGLSASVVFLPAGLKPYYAGLIVFASVTAVCLAYPIFLLYFVIVTSALSGLLRVFDSLRFGVGGVSLSGLRWAFVFSLATGLLLINIRAARIPRVLVPLAILVAWAAVRFALTPLGTPGAKDVIFYALPVVLGVYTLFVVNSTRGAAAPKIETALLSSVAIPIAVYVVLIVIGLVEFTETGPRGLVGPRAVALYLLIVLALALAKVRHAGSSNERTAAVAITIVALATILLTLSRTASVVALGLVVVSRANPQLPTRLVLRGIGIVVITVLLIWNVPAFRERSFHRVEEGLIESVGHFNTMGRASMWPIVFGNALLSPVIGQAPGSARLALVRLRPRGDEEEHHPHNEYIQVFHDLGIIGLAMLLWAWTALVRRMWRSWSSATTSGNHRRAKWNLAGVLAAGVILLTSITDNTLHYSFVMGPAFMIMMTAEFFNSRENLVGADGSNKATVS